MRNNLDLNVMIPIAVLCHGGTEAQTLKLCRALVKLGCKIEIVCFYDYREDVVKEYEESGTGVTLLGHTSRSGKLSLFKALYRIYRRHRPDVVHVQYVEQGFIALSAAWAAGVPNRFATVHQLGTPYGRLQRILLRAASRLSTTFLCVSRAAECSWFADSALWAPGRAGSRRHWTMYNCVDVERIARTVSQENREALRARYGISGQPVIGVVGRIIPEKGQGLLLEAFSIVAKTLPTATLLVIGEDYQRNELMLRAEVLGLSDRIILTGRLPLEAVYALYGIMDVVAVPSHYEGFGLTAVEAMAAGRPVVASRVGGLAEIIEDGVTGVLVKPGDVRALATAINTCLNTPSYAANLGRSGYLRAKATYSLPTYDEEIRALYAWAKKRLAHDQFAWREFRGKE